MNFLPENIKYVNSPRITTDKTAYCLYEDDNTLRVTGLAVSNKPVNPSETNNSSETVNRYYVHEPYFVSILKNDNDSYTINGFFISENAKASKLRKTKRFVTKMTTLVGSHGLKFQDELFKDLDTRIDTQIILDYNLYNTPTSDDSEFIDENQVINELNSCTKFVPLN